MLAARQMALVAAPREACVHMPVLQVWSSCPAPRQSVGICPAANTSLQGLQASTVWLALTRRLQIFRWLLLSARAAGDARLSLQKSDAQLTCDIKLKHNTLAA